MPYKTVMANTTQHDGGEFEHTDPTLDDLALCPSGTVDEDAEYEEWMADRERCLRDVPESMTPEQFRAWCEAE